MTPLHCNLLDLLQTSVNLAGVSSMALATSPVNNARRGQMPISSAEL